MMTHVSFGLVSLYRQVRVFIETGNLPSESSVKRNRMIILGFWLISLIDWVVYIIVLVNYSKHDQYKLLWRFNFGETFFINFIMYFAFSLQLIAYYNFKRSTDTLNSPTN